MDVTFAENVIEDAWGHKARVTDSQVETFKQRGLIEFRSAGRYEIAWDVTSGFAVHEGGDDGEVCIFPRYGR